MAEARTILLTGGTGIIGSQLAKHMLSDGHRVITVSRTDISASKFAEQLDATFSDNQLKVIQIDLESDDAANTLALTLEQSGIYPNCLINCARNPEYLKLGKEGRPNRSHWLNEYFLNVVVAYDLAMTFANQDKSTLESIINISSIYGIVAPRPDLYDNFLKESPISYGVAKAALIHLTKELAVRLAGQGIRVNTVSYGGVEGRADDAFRERYASLCPSGGMLFKEDIYGAVSFLVSNGSSRMTGQNLVVDGGWTVW